MPRGHILHLRWNALLSEFRRSGLTQAEFCERRGISIHSFRKHLYRVPAPKPTPANPLPSDRCRPLPPRRRPPRSHPRHHDRHRCLPTAPRAAPGMDAGSPLRPASIPTPFASSSPSSRSGPCSDGSPLSVFTSPKNRPTCERASTASPRWRRGCPRARSPLRPSLRLHQQATVSDQDPLLGPRWPGRLGQAARERYLPYPARHGRSRRDDHRRPRRAAGRHRPECGPTAAPRHATRHTPPKFGEFCANTRSRVYVVEGMITPADPLPDDLETAHQLIRELLETLGQQIHLNAKLQHQLEQLLRQRLRQEERADRSRPALALRPGNPAQAEPEPHRNPTRSPSRSRSEFAPAQEGPRPQAAARKPAPQASHARRLPRTASVPRLRRRAEVHRLRSPRTARIRPRLIGRARTYPAEIRLSGPAKPTS